MAGGGTEIARAFVTIIPKSDGKFGSEIDKSLGQLGKTGDEQGTKAGKAFAEKFGAFGGKAGALAGKALAVGLGAATAGVIGFAKSSVEAGRNFDASMSQVAATMGKSVDEIQDLRAFAQEMGAKTAFSASEAADALNYMALAGYDAQTSMSMLPNVLNLAAAGSMDLASASDMVTDTQSALGLSLDETSALVDKMAAAASKTNTSVSQLGSAFLTVGGTAKNLTGGTTEAAQALGLLADNGIKGSEGGTALRNVLLGLSSAKFAESFGQMGVAVYDAEGKMRSLKDIFGDMNTAMEGMTVEQKTELISKAFNKVDLKSVNALLGTNAERWDEVAAAIDDSQGAAQKMADTQLDNLEGDLTIFGSALEGAQIALSDGLTPALREFVQWGTEKLGTLTEYLQTEEFKTVASDVLNGVRTGIEGVGNAIQFLAQNGQTIVPVLTGLSIAFAAFKTASIVSGAITALGAALPAIGATGAAAGAGLSATAAGETAAGTAAGAAAGNMMRMGAAILMIGGGVALAALGIGLLAQSAIALADNGNGAALVMVGLGVGLAALVGVAALAGPALTAGAVGMLAFGAATLMVSAGVMLASIGITMLATQLPTIAAFGTAAAVGILAMGAGLLVMGAGALVAGAGLLVMAPAMLLASAAMVAFAPATAAVSAACGALGGALHIVSGAVLDVGTGAKNMGDGLTAAAGAMPQIGENAVPAGTGILSLADAMGQASANLTAGSAAMATAGAGAAALAAGVLVTAAAAASAAASFGIMASAASALGGITSAAASSSAAFSALSAVARNAFTTMATSAASSVARIKTAINSIPKNVSVKVNISHGQAPYPVYSVSGTLNPTAGTKPTYSVSWHYLAAGGILNQPVFVAGEAGAEVVAPLSELSSMLDESNQKYGGGDTNIYVDGIQATPDSELYRLLLAVVEEAKVAERRKAVHRR